MEDKNEEITNQEEKSSEVSADEKKEEKELTPYEIVEKKLISQCEIEYVTKISAEEFFKKEEKIYKFIKSNTLIEGFRKGKAPQHLLKVRFEKEVHKQLAEETAENITGQIIEKDSLKTMGTPVLKDWKIIEEEKDGKKVISGLNMIIAFEVEPEISISPELLNDIPVKVLKIEYTDEDCAKEIERLRQEAALLDPKSDDEPFEEGNAVAVNIEVTDENGNIIPSMSQANVLIKLPKESLPENVFNALIGKKCGEKIEVDNPNERVDKDGKIVSTKDKWIINILEIKKITLPNLDDEFAKDLGAFQTLDELKAQIKKEFEMRKEEEEKSMIKQGIETYLISKLDVQPPPAAIKEEFAKVYHKKLEYLKKSKAPLSTRKYYEDNLSFEDYFKIHLEMIGELIYKAIAKAEKIEVSEEDIDKEINILAEQYGRKPLAIRAQMEANKSLDTFKESVLRKKTVELLIKKAKIDFVGEDEYKEEQKKHREIIQEKVMAQINRELKTDGEQKTDKPQE